ncbi:MAG: ABC transporter ATP-binding protein, partial [Gammaproteobacteria bacterium]|nr:ABC transporter ATP-binding protein [Gammaproteobacteria bacterium]
MHPEPEPLLSLRGLSVAYPHAAPAVQGVDLDVLPGECLGVVGPSGAGKTQLFLASLGLLPPQAQVAGSARYAGTELLGLDAQALARLRGGQIGMVFQDPRASLTPHLTIGAQIAEVRRRHLREGRAAARAAAHALLERMQVGDAARRLKQYPHELSGGLCQRAMLAVALAAQPRLLIADEPTTALDLTVQAQILALLLELRRTTRLAIVLITHDLGTVAGLADRVAQLESGRLVRSGPVAGLAGAVSSAPAAEVAGGAAQAPLLSLQEVAVRHRLPGFRAPTLEALRDVDLELAPGRSLGLVGESGSGKSTLLRVALALQAPSAGRVSWDGQALPRGAALRAARRALQPIFQDPAASLDPRLRVAQQVGEGL